RRCFVQVILSCIGDLGVDCRHAFLVAGALCLRERGLVALEVFRVLDLTTVGQRGERAQSEINADLIAATVLFVDDLDLQIEIPATAGVLCKRAAFDLALDRAAVPEPIATLARVEHSRIEWINASLELAATLKEARERFPSNERFAMWLAETGLDS